MRARLRHIFGRLSGSSGLRDMQVQRRATQLGPWRLLLTGVLLLLAVVVARFGVSWPLISAAEHVLYDARAIVAAPRVAQDERVTMVTYTDEVLIERRVRNPLDRALLAGALARLDTMGARSIGIDILFDQATDADDQLVNQLRAMRTPTFVAFADPENNPNQIQLRQSQFLREFQGRIVGGHTGPASIRLEADPDNVVRRWPSQLAAGPTFLPVAMARAGGVTSAADLARFASYRGAIRFRLPSQLSMEQGVDTVEVFNKMPITSFTDPALTTPDVLPVMAEQIRGRHILIGGDIADTDLFATSLSPLPDPATGEPTRMIGLEIHANILAQILDNALMKPVPQWGLWLAAMLAVLGGVMTALLDLKPWQSATIMLAQLALIIGFPFGLQMLGIDTLSLPVAGGAAGWLLAFIAIGSAVRAVNAEERSYAQGALGKYLPRDIAQEILRDPSRLALHGEKKAIYCLFSDLEGFTSMSHAMSPENVAFVLNAYLDTLSEVILDHGGTIDKFVGDAVVAFWGAPIQRPDDAQQASRALLAMAKAGDAFSRRMSMEAGGTLPPVGRTRVGLHYGEAVVGNFGGEGRIQYTALGDSMNTAARLEGANKQMKSRALISAEALAPLAATDRAMFVPMGRIQLRGRSQPVDAFEPRPDLTPEQRAMVAALVAAHDAGKDDSYRALRDALLSAALPQRGSIDFLIERLEMTGPGEFYALA